MTTSTVVKSVSLFFRQGSSDKEYNIFLENSVFSASMFDVRVTYGRRGNANQTTYKAWSATMPMALKAFNDVMHEKVSKGYVQGKSLATQIQQIADYSLNQTMASAARPAVTEHHVLTERQMSELVPQLLNPIEISELDSYVNDDKYLAQEKLDGKRIMVDVTFGKVTASNRRSWVIGIPKDIEQELAKFDDCVLDGELVGGVYYVFDLLSHNGEDLKALPCVERFDRLVHVIGDQMLEQVGLVPTAFSTQEKQALAESLSLKEGIVFKQVNAPYTAGRPNKGGAQVKCKFWSSATCVVSAINAKRSIAVSVDSPDGFVAVGNVTVPPNYELPQLGDYVEIKYLYYYVGGSLYQPQYLGVRDDVDIDLLESLKPKSEDTDE